MPVSKNGRMIGGFDSVQAVRRSGKGPAGPRLRNSDLHLKVKEEPGKPAEETPRKSGKFARTIVPEKHEIECYSCSYKFVLTGKLHDTFCPKCKELLKVDHRIIEDECEEEMATIGTVEIRPEARINGARIVGGNVILAGDARGATIHAFRTLELCDGANLDFKTVEIKDLVIRPGAKFTFRNKLQCRNLEVRGSIRANFQADGRVTVFPGGCLRGQVRAPHLVVEEGGGLKAKVAITDGAKVGV